VATEDEYGDDEFYSGEEDAEGTYEDDTDRDRAVIRGDGGANKTTADYEDDAEAAAERALSNVIGRMVPVKSIGTIDASSSATTTYTPSPSSVAAVSVAPSPQVRREASGAGSAGAPSGKDKKDEHNRSKEEAVRAKSAGRGGYHDEEYEDGDGYEDDGFEAADDAYGDEEFEQ
jgi:hypothetical protein